MNGEGVARDFAAALRFARSAADQGLPGGEYNVGVVYDYARGIPRDVRTAVKWYSRAAAQGLGEAQARLMQLASEGVAEAAAAVRRLRQ